MWMALLVFGAALAYSAGRMVYRSHAAARWPVAQGTVESSSVETMRSKRSATYVPRVRYHYDVGGQRFTSETLSFGTVSSGDSSEAHAWVRRFPQGASVPVHYAPGEPSLACLDTTATGIANYVVALGGAGAVVLAGAGLLEMVRSRGGAKKQKRKPQKVAVGGGAPR